MPKAEKKESKKASLEAFQFRNVGPAFLSGRIADIVFHPENDNIWYVAVGSGGVWKAENAGTTWTPLLTIKVLIQQAVLRLTLKILHRLGGHWENVGGRHVAYGDGIYRSQDGGKSWENRGLKASSISLK